MKSPNRHFPPLSIFLLSAAVLSMPAVAFPQTEEEAYPQTEEEALVEATPFAEVEVVRERYPDGTVKTEREVTLDADGNFVNHGVWKTFDPKGKLLAEGQFNMGQRVGAWTRWYSRGQSQSLRDYPFNRFRSPFVAQATFVDSKMDGDWIIFDSNQEKCIQITLRQGLRHGPTTIWLPGGQVYRESMYDNGLSVGDVKQRDRSTGALKTATTYLDGRQSVTKVTYFPHTKKKKTVAQFLEPKMQLSKADDFWNGTFAEYDLVGNPLRHGRWQTWYSNGQPHLEGYYQRDVELGTFTWWHPNGQKAVTGEYVNGEQVGSWVWWHANGVKATTGAFHQGLKTGRWRTWTDDGQLDQQSVYDHTNVETPPVAHADEPLPIDPAEAEEAEEVADHFEFPVLPWMR